MPLGNRLSAAATLVRDGVRVVDVGTDHAYLPVELIKSGKAVAAIACDIGEGPLMNARETVKRFGMEDKIDLRLCDGLSLVSADEVDDIIICGMGGELIAQIIGSSKWTRDIHKHYILQPMTAADDLRIWLAENGFSVISEKVARDTGKLYIVMLSVYTGEKYAYSLEYPYVGTVTSDGGLNDEYLEWQLRRVRRHARALPENEAYRNERDRLFSIASAIQERIKERRAAD